MPEKEQEQQRQKIQKGKGSWKVSHPTKVRMATIIEMKTVAAVMTGLDFI